MVERLILKLSCPDRPGIVAAVSTFLFEHGYTIVESQQFDDPDIGKFFMRVVFKSVTLVGDCSLSEAFGEIARKFEMAWEIQPANRRLRVMLLTSTLDHCLADLIYRWRINELPMDIVGVVSNHPRQVFSHLDFGVTPFHHLPVTKATKTEQEAQLWSLICATGTELVVLARYMQIFSDVLADKLHGQCINIHHSFLPGFKGARPYHQAHVRGVKLIGATAHYVTGDLDEGPIIEQDVERISHCDDPDDLARKGRDIERRVLARAVRYHLENRIVLHRNKTIVFRD